MMEIKTIKIDESEFKLIATNDEGKKFNFLLRKKNRGVYAMGRAYQLYVLNGLEKNHLKEIGWTSSDNYGGEFNHNGYLKGIQSQSQCIIGAKKYITKILSS